MAIRNTFTQQPQDQPDDPYAIFGLPMPAAPAMPMDGGNEGVGIDPAWNDYPANADATTARSAVTAFAAPPPISTPGGTGSEATTAVASSSGLPNVPAPGNDANAIQGMYSKFLGRNATAEEIQSHLGNPGGLGAVENLIANSPEADAYNKRNKLGNYAQLSTPPATPAAPVQEKKASPLVMPESDLGDSVSGGLRSLIGSEGMTSNEASLLERVNAIIASGGHLPEDSGIEQQQLESAREDESRAFTGQLNDARDELAARGLVGEPGVPQGQEGEAISTISRNLAPSYSEAVRGIKTSQMQLQESRLQSAISTATGLDTDAAHNLLTALGEGTQRQLGLASIALDSLSQNMQWEEFLANYGLNRDQILNSIQSGNSSALATIIALFESVANQSAKGHV